MITNTAETIQKLSDFRAEVTEKLAERETVAFQVRELQIDNETMSLGDTPLSKDATKKMLSHFRVKNSFMDLHKKMNPSDWNTLKEKLKGTSSEQSLYARKTKVDGKVVIDDLYLAAPKVENMLEIDQVFHELIDSIVGTGKDIEVSSTQFLEDKDEVVVTLLEHDNPVDVFQNGKDMWKTGKRLVWNGLRFSIDPFFLRLVCSNGNCAPQYGFRANVSNNKFKMEKIKQILEKEITLQSDTMEVYLRESALHLKHHNVSVAEYLHFRRMFNEESHAEILKKWFDDSPLNNAYGSMVFEQPHKWQATADTGKKAYDFFNDLTYIASHPDEAKMTDRERLDLQIQASGLLFKKKLDLEMVAPKTTILWNGITDKKQVTSDTPGESR